MRILDPQDLILQKCRIHPLIFISLHSVALTHQVLLIVFFLLLLLLLMRSKFIEKVYLRILCEDLRFCIEVIVQFLTASSRTYVSVSRI